MFALYLLNMTYYYSNLKHDFFVINSRKSHLYITAILSQYCMLCVKIANKCTVRKCIGT